MSQGGGQYYHYHCHYHYYYCYHYHYHYPYHYHYQYLSVASKVSITANVHALSINADPSTLVVAGCSIHNLESQTE